MTDPSGIELTSLLRGVRAAASVERIDRGLTRPQRRATTGVVDRRLLDAATAGATDEQLAEALGRSVSRTQERLRAAMRARDGGPPPPDEVVSLRTRVGEPPRTPDIWRAVPRCDRPAPPPWPVSRRCRGDSGHAGNHDFEPSAGARRSQTSRPVR